MYIIPITIISTLVLLFTTHKVKVKSVNSGKQRFFDREALVGVVQQLVIVFLSAILAMWLTEYLENKTTVEHVQAFIAPMRDNCITQTSHINNTILEIDKLDENSEKGTDEQLLGIIKTITRTENTFFETMMYNDDFVATLSPTTFMAINIDLENMRRLSKELDDVTPENIDRQKACEQIAEYLFYMTDATFALDVLAHDVKYNTLNLVFADSAIFEANTFYKIYNNDVRMLQEIFDVDLSDWENKRKYAAVE